MICKQCVRYNKCGTIKSPLYADELNKSEILCSNFKDKRSYFEKKHRILNRIGNIIGVIGIVYGLIWIIGCLYILAKGVI